MVTINRQAKLAIILDDYCLIINQSLEALIKFRISSLGFLSGMDNSFEPSQKI